MLDHGFSVRRLAQVAGVTEHTVRRWKKRGAIPEPYLSALQLRLGENDIVGTKAWDGWRVCDDLLISPEGDKYTQADIRASRLHRKAVEEYRSEIARRHEEAHQARELRARVADVVVALEHLVKAAASLREQLPTDDLAIARSMKENARKAPQGGPYSSPDAPSWSTTRKRVAS